MAQPSSTLLSLSAAAMALGGISLLASSALIVAESHGESAPARKAACYEACALPGGVSSLELSPAAADELASRGALCADLACDRITASHYQAAIAALARPAEPPPPEHVWARALIDYSSEYSTASWSAAQVLGPPDTYPQSGDNSSAWASMVADGKTEFIEVSMPGHRASAVEVYETFNAGAIRSIDIRLASGIERRVFTGEPRPRAGARIERADFSCTEDKVVAVRVTLDTSKVSGWNEIDAIALRPCR